ncbi:hypothetical protein SEPCBS119000_003685 [Sporothrix epigloea]|uniref:MYND-type zinc finger protein samB n=1 Tax=Sporothrix epigloea TaxID=1892477 RepID=A0ABP0DN86_9PEZI
MREVNFSIPNVNKASVGITPALYDRRALDCTSTLPLINSLNHLAYLTTSSARIRDILTVDGGIERLVCILKQGRSKDMMDMWKWNLAFQCVVNIGVRGTEAVRTRVVEADMVPVIATILDNYIKVIEKCREKVEETKHHNRQRPHDLRAAKQSSSFTHRTANNSRFDLDQHRAFRRQAPPPSIDVLATFIGPAASASGEHVAVSSSREMAASGSAANAAVSTTRSGGTALSATSSTDGSTSNTDNDATPTMAQFHITSPQHSARTSTSALPSAMPAQLALPSALISSGTTPARRFHHFHHPHHHHHHAGAAGSLPSSSGTPPASSPPSSSAVTATPTRHSGTTSLGTATESLFAAPPSTLSVSLIEANEASLMRAAFDQYPTPFGSRPGLGNSQPASPTTPLSSQIRSPTGRPTSLLAPTGRSRRRPSIRHQNSSSGPSNEVDDTNAESVQSDEPGDAEMSGTGEIQTIQTAVDIQDINMEESDSMLGSEALELTTTTVSETQGTGTFDIAHRGSLDGSIPPAAATTTPVPTLGMSPNRPVMVATQQPMMPATSVPRYLLDRQLAPPPQVIAAMPREEDVLMSLQLLAYVSKYCNLRSYFQKSHFVPRLKIGKELELLDGDDMIYVDGGANSNGQQNYRHQLFSRTKLEVDGNSDDSNCKTSKPGAAGTGTLSSGADSDDVSLSDVEEEEEYLLPNDVNIFPLVEKFTVRYHSTDMQYWAGVVMRNLCRKDETRGGIRQCAYYQCGKWEEYTRQFAKCRRCRRTKYCSKECQKSAWTFHRHWCVAATP